MWSLICGGRDLNPLHDIQCYLYTTATSPLTRSQGRGFYAGLGQLPIIARQRLPIASVDLLDHCNRNARNLYELLSKFSQVHAVPVDVSIVQPIRGQKLLRLNEFDGSFQSSFVGLSNLFTQNHEPESGCVLLLPPFLVLSLAFVAYFFEDDFNVSGAGHNRFLALDPAGVAPVAGLLKILVTSGLPLPKGVPGPTFCTATRPNLTPTLPM